MAQTFTEPQTFGDGIVAAGSTPTYTLGTGAGTGATVTITGNNTRGFIELLTGTTPSAALDIITVTFATPTPYIVAPIVLISPYNNNAGALGGTSGIFVRGDMVTTAQFILRAGPTALTAGATYRIAYMVMG